MQNRNKEVVEIQVEKDIRRRAYSMQIAKHSEDVDKRLMAKFVWEEVPIDYGISDVASAGPCILFQFDEAQNLMDELWRAGLRPGDHLTTAGEKESMEAHLFSLRSEVEFLRTLVKHQMGIPL